MHAVGFDLDETLAATSRDRTRILADATDRADAPDLSRDAYLDAHAEHSGRDSRQPVFEALLEGRDTDATAEQVTAAYRREIEAAMEPVPGAADLVDALRRDHRVGLLTDGPVETQRSKLQALGWSDLFDATVVTGSLPAPKPDRGAFLALADALGVPPDRVVYVGDHPDNDVAGAADAGLTPVQVVYEGGPEPHPEAAATVRRAALAEDLPGVVARLS
ncbi:HAD family hydrolase [Halorarius halobius]|uniref:HAD family hydrolase n=1 Tax=Halorarius halobius TaxID=2962671 RepID=UPI0020CB7754|nr:HAD family hydrolase [Halorarius halobius]